MPTLLLSQDEEKGRLVTLDKVQTIVGRSLRADITLVDTRASRQHARITKRDGAYFIEDMKSRNGTLVNGSRVTTPRKLQPGDRIEIGGACAVFDPQNATAVAMVEDAQGERIREATSGLVQLGDEGTLLRFSPQESTSHNRRDPMVRLQIIYHFADRMRQCFAMDELLDCILDGLIEVLTPDRAAVLLANRQTGSMESAASRSNTPGNAGKSTFGTIPISSSIVSRAIASRAPVVARDARADQRFSASESIVASRIGTAVCVPMISGNDLCGLLYLDFLFRPTPLEEADLELLAGLANQSAMAIGNSMHHAEEVERREMEMQLGVARKVHDKLLSHTEGEMNGIRVRSLNRPSKTVGGDYLGVFPVDGKLTLAVADGTGHGIGAALLMGTARAYLVALLEETARPVAEIVARLNRLVCEDVDPGLFVSLGLLRIDAENRVMSGVSAGHEPPLLYRGSEGRFLELPTGGTVLGLDPDSEYTPMPPVELLPNDRIVLFTDGIVEQRNDQDEEFGFDRFLDAIAASSTMTAEGALASIMHTVDAWRGEVEQGDDFSLMVVEIRPPSTREPEGARDCQSVR